MSSLRGDIYNLNMNRCVLGKDLGTEFYKQTDDDAQKLRGGKNQSVTGTGRRPVEEGCAEGVEHFEGAHSCNIPQAE